jgi:uncharacterized membrane protein
MTKAIHRKEVVKAAGNSKTSMLKWVFLVAAALLVGAGVVSAFNFPGLGKSEKIRPANGAVTIPLAKVSDGKAHFYSVDDGGKNIGFFMVKGSDGTIHTAFDACDVCFREKKGYDQQGEFMVCKNCNRKFAINMIGQVGGGGCNPSYLNHFEDGKNVVIKIADLKSGTRFF